MYPIKLKPVYQERIWGGDNLNKMFGRGLPNNKIGESWEVSTHKNGMSFVENGELAGKSLDELIKTYKSNLLGKKYVNDTADFPLLIKILDANDKLSIQVHPADEYAYRAEGEPGKTEAWYIAAATGNAQIVYGIKDNITKEEFLQAVKDKKLSDTLCYVPVKTGDMVLVPAGIVHALLDDVVAYEVQQNSDTTYRVYDFDRVDAEGNLRELHIDKAVEVISFGKKNQTDFSKPFVACDYFCMKKITVDGELIEYTKDSYIVYWVIGGEGQVIYKDYVLHLAPGETILIPACLESIIFKGKLQLLKIQ